LGNNLNVENNKFIFTNYKLNMAQVSALLEVVRLLALRAYLPCQKESAVLTLAITYER